MGERKVADIVVEALSEAGVRRCYGVAGDTLNHLTAAIQKSGISWVHVRHEEAGAFAAGAEALLSDQLTACAGRCGPGSLHFINGLYEAHRNGAPVVLIVSQLPSTELGVDFPEEVRFAPLYERCSVFCEVLLNPREARRMAALAAQAALTKRGVAVLIIPADISAAMVEEGPSYRTHVPAPVLRPSEEELDELARQLNRGGRIAIYAGAGSQHAGAQVKRLCEILRAPMVHTSRAKDFLEADNPCNVGMTGIFGSKAGYDALMDCETLVLLGCDFAWRQFYPSHAQVIQIDRDPSHLGRRHPLRIGVVGDIADTLDELLPRLTPRADDDYLVRCRSAYAEALERLRLQERPGRRGLIHPQQLAMLLDRHADADAVFTADGGSPMVWLLRHIRITGNRRTLTSHLHGATGNAMPQAIGVKCAWPERQVIAMSGDGGLSMLMGDLLTLVQEGVALKVVVFNNGALGFAEAGQQLEGFPDAYTGLLDTDFSKVAEAVGLAAWRVARNEDLEDAVKVFLAHQGAALLDVKVNRRELVIPSEADGVASAYSTSAILTGRGGASTELFEGPT